MLLTPADHERITQAVQQAERATRGEIVCVINEEASDYAEVPLVWAAALVLAAPLLPLTLAAAVLLVHERFQGWLASPPVAEHSPTIDIAYFATIQAFAFLLIAGLASIPAVRRALTPAGLKQHFVRQRAWQEFNARGVANTAERTGLLLYVSVKDRCAELIADAGINAKVAPATWGEIMAVLKDKTKRGRPADGFVLAIEACGRELSCHFPATATNPNELPDEVDDPSARPDPQRRQH
ncbi:MAG: TPM domain-containing protein [Hyphomonadaceae bacterium]